MSGTIRMEGVGKSFDGAAALVGIDLELSEGSFTALVGPSGCGKSTLLRLVAGMTEPTTGSISIGTRSPERVRRSKEIGWMAQRPALLPWRSALENVTLAQTINPQPDRPQASPEDLLSMVGMADFVHAYPGTLSGGMQQRVALARTLAIGAPVWLMDEPFSALDELTREVLADDLLRLWQEFRPTVVWVTHHIPEAVRLADRLVLLSPRPGRVAGLVPVDLPRPRQETSTAFQDVVAKARSCLRLPRPAEMTS